MALSSIRLSRRKVPHDGLPRRGGRLGEALVHATATKFPRTTLRDGGELIMLTLLSPTLASAGTGDIVLAQLDIIAAAGGAGTQAATGGAVDPFVFRLSIFVLAVFVGYFVV